jgi:hypothetical protein
MSWKKWSTGTGKGPRCLRVSLLSLCLLPLAASATVVTADKVKEFQAHFDHEPRATAKIKDLEKLGEAQFAAATRAQQAGDHNAIGLIFEKYRDNVRAAFDLLKQQEPSADKHSEGYRHLELQTRRGIREVEDILIIVPAEVRPPLELVRDDLIRTDDELIALLFPRRTKTIEPVPPPAGAKP